MLELLHFIFSSFWTWAGSVILIAAVSGALLRGVAFTVALFRR